MKKRLYELPKSTVFYMQTETLTVVSSINSNVDLRLGGGPSDENARVKQQSNYDVWDDDWSANK